MSETTDMINNVIPLHEQPAPAKPVHIMVDLETLGLGESAVILSIGAVVFDETGVTDNFYTDIDPAKYPGAVDISTIKFWMEQVAEGTKAPMAGVLDAGAALTQFHSWLMRVCNDSPSDIVLWANGIDFDIPKLAYLYKICGAPTPWKYNKVRDCRTIFKLFPSYGVKPYEVDKHNALADAEWQANYLASVLTNLSELCDVLDF